MKLARQEIELKFINLLNGFSKYNFYCFEKEGKFPCFKLLCNDVFISTVDLESSELTEIRWLFRKVDGFTSSNYHIFFI